MGNFRTHGDRAERTNGQHENQDIDKACGNVRCPSMVTERSTTMKPDLTTTNYYRRDDNEDSSDSKALPEEAEGPTKVYPKRPFIDEFVDIFLFWMELEESTAVHSINV